MIRVNQMHRGQAVMRDGKLCQVWELQIVAKGNWRSFYQIKFRNVETGQVVEQRMRPDEELQDAFLETKPMEYLYSSGKTHTFMDPTNYEQIDLQDDFVGDQILYLIPNTGVTIMFHEGKPVGLTLPDKVTLEVKDTPPGIKGATATNVYKEATLETGLKAQVPPFIEIGEKIILSTLNNEYVGRVKE